MSEKYRNGLIGTVLFHGTVLLLLLFSAFRTPLPIPVEQGIMVDLEEVYFGSGGFGNEGVGMGGVGKGGRLRDFGNGNTGSGNVEPPMGDPAPAQPKTQTPPKSQQGEEILTQNVEESVSIPAKTQSKTPPKETPVETPKPASTETPTVEHPVTPERTVDQRTLYSARGNTSSTATSQGEAGGQGNQGISTGAPNVQAYGEGGDGSGTGTGAGSGTGNKWGLSGRGLVGTLPIPAYTVQDEGTVVVTIIVDKEGNVISANYTSRGSTTLNRTLIDAAEKAASQAKFTKNPNVIEQKGTITYTFKYKGE